MRKKLNLNMIFGIGIYCLAYLPSNGFAKPNENYGIYTLKDSKKAQKDIDKAINTPMETLIDKAKSLRGEDMYLYGLALELGRPPATSSLSTVEKAKLFETFERFLDKYTKKRDGINLKGNEPILLSKPDFWILLGRSGGKPSNDLSNLVGSLNGFNEFAPESSLSSTDTVGTSIDGKPLPIYDQEKRSAGQSCIINARTAARLNKVTILSPSSAPHLSLEKFTELQNQAKELVIKAEYIGVSACGSRDYYTKVYDFTSNYLGKLGTLK